MVLSIIFVRFCLLSTLLALNVALNAIVLLFYLFIYLFVFEFDPRNSQSPVATRRLNHVA